MAKKNKSVLRGTLLGMALGAGVVAFQEYQKRKHPLDTPAQKRINRGLEKALRVARLENRLKLDENSRFIIFSDLHKGAGDDADDFNPCKATYHKALDYYYENGFTLVLLGDVEELWENQIPEVMQTHADVFDWEGRFLPERYIRVRGNHDDAWNDPLLVEAHLQPLYDHELQLSNGLVLEYDDAAVFGELFLVHGHQGTLDSDFLAGFSPHLLPIYRQLQNQFHIGRTTPAYDDYLRGEHDTQMYRWASQQEKLILIAGHTHRPVWSSLTHLDQLYIQLYALREKKEKMGKAKYKEEFQGLLREIDKRKTKHPPVNDTLKTTPCYFNTGCCRFADGDITGIEITGECISLIKWDSGTLERMENVTMPLAELFALL